MLLDLHPFMSYNGIMMKPIMLEVISLIPGLLAT
jgi:hypothetical protein